MSDYPKVAEALKAGADPQFLCATCPWDRFCVQPPSMTESEYQAQVDKASEEDRRKADQARAEGKDPGMPVGMLLTAMTMSSNVSKATICPVLALQLRTPQGKHIVDVLKIAMQAPVLATDHKETHVH